MCDDSSIDSMSNGSRVGKTPTCGFFTFTDRIFFILVAGCCPFCDFFELFALRSFDCEVTLEARTTRHSTPAAVAKQRYSTNPERGCLLAIDDAPPRASQVPRSCPRRLMPGAIWSIRGQRTTVADFAPRGRADADRIMSACQRPRVSEIMMATPTAPSSRSRRGFRLRGRPRRQDGITTTAATWRIWSDVGVKTTWLEQNGFNRVLLNTSFNTKVAHARGEDEWSWKLQGEEVV